ncbi:hypothetical protein [Pseudomonas extremaustralis]|uniref:hypothetical protein n=1 Tax=Pseudomonas extremaustralis TaxID=359110 RepID=UPI00389A2880
MLRRNTALHPHLIAVTGGAVVRALAVFIEHDHGGAAIIQPDHFNRDVADRHVIHRLEGALDRQLAAQRTHGNTADKVWVAHAHRSLRIPHPQHTIHPQQRRHIRRIAHRIQRTHIPRPHLLAIHRQALMKAIQLMFDKGNVGSVGHP